MKKRVKRAKEWKKSQVTDLKGLIGAYPTVGMARIRGLGGKQLQRIRKEFKGKAQLRVSRNSLISVSLADGGINDMVDYIDDQVALILTNFDPFELYNVVEAGKIPAPIKAGAIAPHDIVIEDGATSLKPGPIVGELQSLGIPAGIEGGKVVIKQRKVIVKEGEKVSPPLADILARLEIYPIREGLDLLAVYDRTGNVVFTPDVLHIDPAKYFADLKEAAKAAFSLSTHIKYGYPTRYTIRDLFHEAGLKSVALALQIAYPTTETIKPLLQKAYAQAHHLSINACLYERETMPYLLGKAVSEARRLATQVEGKS
ncbi:MAG: 50S ribosomal protein L10 [Methanophagales archaeon ANME-1-THS]|nr:MAG: 50S ribosomal protein L10 [Methanophagales archaeon ANME-1-THS]